MSKPKAPAPAWANRITGYGEEAPDQLLANPANWRIHPKQQQDALSGVLADVGIVQNVLVNKRSGMLIDGHLRVSLAMREHQPTIPVTYVDLSPAEEAEILATLDPVAAMAGADREKLDALLREVNTGNEAVQRLLSDVAAQSGLTYGTPQEETSDPDALVDRAAELQAKWQVARGDVWQIGRHRLMCGDSTSKDDVARLMDGAMARLMFTDPPYGVSYDAEWRGRAGHATMGNNRTGKIVSDDNADWTSVWPLFDAPILYCWHASALADVVSKSLKDADYDVRQQIIWVKNIPIMSRSSYHWQHEPCWYAVKKGHDANWLGDRKQTTVWDERPPNHIMAGSDEMRTAHPTQKPVGLAVRAIHNHVGEGEVVADAFIGSGTTLVACEQTGRIGYGMEIEPKYCAVTLERLTLLGLEAKRL